MNEETIQEATDIVFGSEHISISPCDIIFIFGGSHPGLWEKAIEAYDNGLSKVIIVTGGYKQTAHRHSTWQYRSTPEADIITAKLIESGIPIASIYKENKSTNSLENVLFAKEIYDFSIVNKILMICKSYGAGRQSRTLKHYVNEKTEIIPYSFDTEWGLPNLIVSRHSWMNNEIIIEKVLTEIGKMINYGNEGYLQPIKEISRELLQEIKNRIVPNMRLK